MFKRSGKFNSKRKLMSEVDSFFLEKLKKSVHYGGNPEHKMNPGDFNLTPPGCPRPDKTLCDTVDIFKHRQALNLLRKGIARGLISKQRRGNYPQNIWSVDNNNNPLEAQLENAQQGTYHGYPMPKDDPFSKVILRAFEKNE